MKWPMSGIKPQTKTIIAIAIGDGSAKTSERAKTNVAAINAIAIWLPTNDPTLEITALTRRVKRSLRLAGAKRTPSSTICGSEVMK
jgi:hypothetical protein